jgi:YVTN family beta-propeller protein
MHSPKALNPARRLLVALTLVLAVGMAVPVFSAILLRGTIATGTSPSSVAVNPISGRVFVVNYFGGSTSVIDAVTESRLATVSSGTGLTIPNCVVVNSVASPARAYVANFWNGTVSVIDESSLTVTSTIASAGYHGSGSPRALAVDGSGATPKLYVAEYGRNSVAVYNAETYAFIKRITVGSSPRALGIFSSMSRKRVFVANRFSNSVTIIDADTDTVVGTVAVGAAPKAIAVDTSTGWAWVTSELGDSVTAINASDTVAATVAVGVRPTGIAIDSAAGRVFVANYSSNTVSVIRTSDQTREATIAVDANPWAVAFDSGYSKAYVTCYGADTVNVIKSSLTTPTSIAVGDGPYALAIDEATTPHKVFVANRLSNNVSVLGDDGMAWLPGITSAYAAAAPVAAVTVDSVATDADSTVVEGSAVSIRKFPAMILGLWVQVDGEGSWSKADILSGAGTSAVRWRLALPQLAPGSHTLNVRVLDQTAAAASSSDGAGSDKGFSAGTSVGVPFKTGTVLQPKQGVACASCHGTPSRGNRSRIPSPLDRCPQIRKATSN